MLIHTLKSSSFSARKKSTKMLNFLPIARKILNLRKNSSAMHHGIVTIPPLITHDLSSVMSSLSYTILLEEVLILFFRHASEAKKMADFDAILRHLHDYWSLNSWYLPLIKAHFVSPLLFSHPPAGFCENISALQILVFDIFFRPFIVC